MSSGRGTKRLVSATAWALGLGLWLPGNEVAAAPPEFASVGGQMAAILTQLEEVNRKLARIEKRLGCPIDEYVDGTCTDNPAGTTVTYCISQGRGIEVAGKFAVEPKAKLEVGARWDVVGLADVDGEMNFPVLVAPLPGIPLGIPIPTELALGASGSHGKGFDICVEIPLQAAAADSGILERIVKGMNPPTHAGDTKYQRRLSRLLNYADRRIPEPVPAGSGAGSADKRWKSTSAPSAQDIDMDILDDAAERLMAGEFQPFNGPLGLFKDPVVQNFRAALELPEPLQQVLDDPDLLFAAMPSFALDNPAQMCSTLGLSGVIASRSPAVAKACNLLGSLPSFEVASSAFATVHRINTLMAELPDEIIFGVGDILPDVNAPKLPTPRPPGSLICQTFPRLCR